jgi:predicted Ser/Thr protein kinase
VTPTEDSPLGEASLADRDSAESTAGTPRRDLALDVARARAEAALFGGAVPLDGFDAPTRVARFSLLRRLGAGAMGVVYAGQDEMLGRRVALKLISPDRAGSTSARERMLREAQALAKLSHPNVVPVFEAGMHEGCIFLAMEYVEGRTLRQYADEQPGWRALVDAYVQAGRGLAAAHDAGLVHRDFKPDNAMFGADGRVRVLDFGLVSAGTTTIVPEPATLEDDASGRLTRTGAILGTPAYMAPEQHLHGPIDARADQFAFCVALHEAVFGARPFEGEGLTALAVAVIDGRIVAPPRREPRWLYRVLRRGLAARADDRWPDMHALVRELERGLGKRNRKWIVLAAGAASIVGALAIAMRDETPRPERSAAPVVVDPPVAARLAPARQITRLTDDVQVGGAALSPDGSSLAYWASRAGQEWLTIAPARGGSGVATPRSVGMAAFTTLRFSAGGDVLSVRREGDGFQLVATSPADATQRNVRSIHGLPRSALTIPGSAAALAPDGRSIAIPDVDANAIVVVDIGGNSTTVGETLHPALEIVWSPDGERIAWVERDVTNQRPPRLVLAASDGSAHREAASYAGLVGVPCTALTFAGNEHLVFAIYGSDSGLDISKLWEQRLDEQRLGFAGEPVLVQDATPGLPAHLSASDDGRKLAFARYDRRETIQVADVLRSGALDPARPSTIDTTNERIAGWTEDGRSVVFFSWREGAAAFYTRAIDSERAVPLFSVRSNSTTLIRRDGERLLFVDPDPESNGPAPVVSVGLDGSKETLGTIELAPWSAALSCASSGCTRIVQEGEDVVAYTVDWTGTPPRELARARLQLGRHPHWYLAPDGKTGALFVWNDGVYLVSLVGRPIRRLVVPDLDGGEPPMLQFGAWTSAGDALYVTGMHIDGHVYAMIRMHIDGRYELVHTEANRWINRPHLTGDGRRIAFGTWPFGGDVWMIER